MLSGRKKKFRNRSLTEKFLNLLDHVHELIHLSLGIIKIEARAGGGFHAEFVHEGLGAMMATAQRNARLVRQRHDVVRVDVP